MLCPTYLIFGVEIGVYEQVYEYGAKSGENAVPTYSYTYSYTHISSCFPNVGSSQMLNLAPFGTRPAVGRG